MRILVSAALVSKSNVSRFPMRTSLLAALGLCAACSSPNELNDANIAAAIENGGKDPSCVSVVLAASLEIEERNSNAPQMQRPNVYRTRQFNAWNPNERRWLNWQKLVDAGLANDLGQVGRSHFFEIKPEFARHFVYAPNNAGSMYTNVCLGSIDVTSVDSFSIPSDAGAQRTRVDYTWGVDQDNPPPSELTVIFPELATYGQATASLELTSDGWQTTMPAFGY